MSVASFDKKQLAKDTLSAISQACTGKKFIGHDGLEYSICGEGENGAVKCFIEVSAKMHGVDKAVARYALVLIGLAD